jgi:glycosyltransferase involved in cell wall biosynthesis
MTTGARDQRKSIGRWELIVTVDGSPDKSAALSRATAGDDARIQVLELPHQGVAATRNAGLHGGDRRARYVMLLDADDALKPTMLERLSGWLDEHPTAPAAHCRATLVDEQVGRSTTRSISAHGWWPAASGSERSKTTSRRHSSPCLGSRGSSRRW